VQIVHASMFVRKVKLMPSVFLAHAKTLERSPAKYPIRRVVCKSFTIPKNYIDVSHEKLFSGQLSTRIVIGLVDNRAYNGDRERNPFNFQHFNLNEIAVYLDRQQQHAVRPVQPDYAHGLYIRVYNSMFAGTGKLCTSVVKTIPTDTLCTRSISPHISAKRTTSVSCVREASVSR